MTWPKWVLLAFFAYSVLITVARIGKANKPTTPQIAAASIVLTGALALLVVIA